MKSTTMIVSRRTFLKTGSAAGGLADAVLVPPALRKRRRSGH